MGYVKIATTLAVSLPDHVAWSKSTPRFGGFSESLLSVYKCFRPNGSFAVDSGEAVWQIFERVANGGRSNFRVVKFCAKGEFDVRYGGYPRLLSLTSGLPEWLVPAAPVLGPRAKLRHGAARCLSRRERNRSVSLLCNVRIRC